MRSSETAAPNLIGISVEVVAASREQAARLLAAARRNLADASLAGLSSENQFDAAYKALLTAAHSAGYPAMPY